MTTATTTDAHVVVATANFLKHEEDIVYTENGSMMFNPYNELNVEITLSEVQSILQKYGIPKYSICNFINAHSFTNHTQNAR
jgi:hypothetical protein